MVLTKEKIQELKNQNISIIKIIGQKEPLEKSLSSIKKENYNKISLKNPWRPVSNPDSLISKIRAAGVIFSEEKEGQRISVLRNKYRIAGEKVATEIEISNLKLEDIITSNWDEIATIFERSQKILTSDGRNKLYDENKNSLDYLDILLDLAKADIEYEVVERKKLSDLIKSIIKPDYLKSQEKFKNKLAEIEEELKKPGVSLSKEQADKIEQAKKEHRSVCLENLIKSVEDKENLNIENLTETVKKIEKDYKNGSVPQDEITALKNQIEENVDAYRKVEQAFAEIVNEPATDLKLVNRRLQELEKLTGRKYDDNSAETKFYNKNQAAVDKRELYLSKKVLELGKDLSKFELEEVEKAADKEKDYSSNILSDFSLSPSYYINKELNLSSFDTRKLREQVTVWEKKNQTTIKKIIAFSVSRNNLEKKVCQKESELIEKLKIALRDNAKKTTLEEQLRSSAPDSLDEVYNEYPKQAYLAIERLWLNNVLSIIDKIEQPDYLNCDLQALKVYLEKYRATVEHGIKELTSIIQAEEVLTRELGKDIPNNSSDIDKNIKRLESLIPDFIKNLSKEQEVQEKAYQRKQGLTESEKEFVELIVDDDEEKELKKVEVADLNLVEENGEIKVFLPEYESHGQTSKNINLRKTDREELDQRHCQQSLNEARQKAKTQKAMQEAHFLLEAVKIVEKACQAALAQNISGESWTLSAKERNLFDSTLDDNQLGALDTIEKVKAAQELLHALRAIRGSHPYTALNQALNNVAKNVIQQYEKLDWEKFFAEHDLKSKKFGLIDYQVYRLQLLLKKLEYTSHDQTTWVELLKHQREAVDQTHQILKDMRNEEEEKIRALQEDNLPPELSQDSLNLQREARYQELLAPVKEGAITEGGNWETNLNSKTTKAEVDEAKNELIEKIDDEKKENEAEELLTSLQDELTALQKLEEEIAKPIPVFDNFADYQAAIVGNLQALQSLIPADNDLTKTVSEYGNKEDKINEAQQLINEALIKDADEDSGLTLAEAEVVWANGFTKRKGYGYGKTIDQVELLRHKDSEITAVGQLWAEIDAATDLTTLRTITINDKYNKNNRELELFKAAFEGAGAPAQDGIEERKVFDNEQITRPDGSKANLTRNGVEVLKIEKEELKMALDLFDDIARQTTADDLTTLIDIDNRAGSRFDDYQLQKLTEAEFIAAFQAQDLKGHGDLVGQVFNRGWKNHAEIFIARNSSTGKGEFQTYLGDSSNAKWNVLSHKSHGQTDVNLNALEVDKKHLTAVNEILEKISKARKASDLPADSDISAAKYDELKVPGNKKYDPVKIILRDKKTQLRSAKVQPDLTEIATELNQKPVILASELKNSDYETELLNLATNDTQRNNRKAEIIAEIKAVRKNKLAVVQQIITNAQTIKDKDGATKEELEKVIADLKTLANSPTDKENKDTNKKLLTDLENKLKLLEPDPDQEGPKVPPQIPTPPPSPTITPEEVEKFEENYDRSKTCRHCPEEFHYDKSLEFLPAKAKVEKDLAEHETACSLKKTAKIQARADVARHEQEECGNNLTNPKIAIYFSPNQGGNQHADLSYAEHISENELTLEKDNQGQAYQETQINDKPTD
ncbi:6780_t:CDS:10 [Entrophospora sp. SA101]|nr:6780_t:CDS:10 [Entrophospora sp. SA101]